MFRGGRGFITEVELDVGEAGEAVQRACDKMLVMSIPKHTVFFLLHHVSISLF